MSADDDLRSMLETLKRDYRRSLPATMESIDTAWKAMSAGSADAACVKTLERALHSIAGAAGTFGLPALGDAAAAAEAFLEPYVEKGSLPDTREAARLGGLLEDVRKAAA